MKGRGALLAGAAALVALSAALWRSGEDPGRDPGALLAVGGPPSTPAPTRAEAFRTANELPPLPASLRGTEEDGALIVDDEGRFVATPDALDLFDYYLSAAGEEPGERVRARIAASIRAHLHGDAAVSAEALLDDYLVYRERAAQLFGDERVLEDLERRIQYIRELRREIFGPEIARALFGAEEERWFVELERRRVRQDRDPGLDEAERRQRLAALDAELPEALRSTRASVLGHTRLREQEAQLREEGAGPAEIALLRESRFGADAAERLSALDADRSRWRERLERYRAELEVRLASASAEERETVREEVRSLHFAGSELVRVRALDRIETTAPTP